MIAKLRPRPLNLLVIGRFMIGRKLLERLVYEK